MKNIRPKYSVQIPKKYPSKSIDKTVKYKLPKNYNLTYEVIIINDAGDQINLNFDHGIKNISSFRIRKNRGVGYARQLGTRISKYNYILLQFTTS